MVLSRLTRRSVVSICAFLPLLLGACSSQSTTASAPPTTVSSVPQSTITEAGIVVVKDLPYYETSDGDTAALDVYRPAAGSDLPLVVLFHGNPVFGQTKASVSTLASLIAERGAVVVAPNWGRRMSMLDMSAIANELKEWTTEQGPCALWAAAELSASYGASVRDITIVGVTTGVLPGQAATFELHPTVDRCLSEWMLLSVGKSILFDTDWLLVPSIWDEILDADPSFLEVSSYWDRVDVPDRTRLVMLAGDITAAETNRSLEGKSYDESEWVRLRDPAGSLREAFSSSGTLEDGSMSFTDVTRVVVELLVEGGWDAELLIVPGVAHSLTGQDALNFVADLVFSD